MIEKLIHRVVNPVINLIEQTQGTDIRTVPQTTKLTLQPFRTAKNTIH